MQDEKLKPKHTISNLREKLVALRHPYGLLLFSAPALLASIGENAYQFDPSGLLSLGTMIKLISGTENGGYGEFSGNILSAGSSGLFFSAETPQTSLTSTGLAMAVLGGSDQRHTLSGLGMSLAGTSASPGSELYNFLRQHFVVQWDRAVVALPLLGTIAEYKPKPEVESRVHVTKNIINVGSIQAHVRPYLGKEAYVVADERSGFQHEVRPGDKLLFLHVNAQTQAYKEMGLIARAKRIRLDFQTLCILLEKPETFSLSADEQDTVKRLSNAPMLGVSHLVRFISSQGFPTWDLSPLPSMFQRAHRLDSQQVSTRFGGERTVKPEDVRVMFITSEMRNGINEKSYGV